MIQLHIFTIHGKIIPVCLHIGQVYIGTVPEGFLCIREIYIGQGYPPATAEIFWCFYNGISYRNIIGIPYPGPRHVKPGTFLYIDMFAIPERIFPPEQTIIQIKTAALLQRGFPILKHTVIYRQISD